MIRIGNDSQHLTITLLGRSHPGSEDFWDGNWVRAEIAVVAGGFRGTVGGDLRGEELDRFRDGLMRLNQSLHGEAELATMEGLLRVRVVGDGRGRIAVDFEVWDEAARATLSGEIADDQTALGPLLRQLNQALLEYPVIGQP
jgi:hypothetical protein